MDGFLLVDKPSGWTSFDVVAKIRSLLRQAGVPKPKVGHCGTLDPLATGLLIVVVGSYTKRAEEFTKLNKVYDVTMKLGQTSTTGDDEGHKTVVSSKKPSQTAVEAVLNDFLGESHQVPPQFSAIKVDGQRAYKLARQGKTAKLEPRPITIFAITDVAYEYPQLSFTTRVSSGTYIRSLVQDIGQQLETGAYMTRLQRSEIGDFQLTKAVAVQQLSAETIYQQLSA